MQGEIMKYQEPGEALSPDNPLSGVVMEPTDYSTNRCYYQNEKYRIWLYQANSLELMDLIISTYPSGRFDMIFAAPLIFCQTAA